MYVFINIYINVLFLYHVDVGSKIHFKFNILNILAVYFTEQIVRD